MRLIKFRAWDKKNKTWANHQMDVEPDGELLPTTSNYEITQFTGLLDKNGKEIYEGDVVSFEDTESEYVDVGIGGQGVKVAETKINAFGAVVFKDGMFGIDAPETETLEKKGFNSFERITDWIGVESFEVLGNIYENENLLK